MFVKTTFEGKSMIKYSIGVIVVNLILIGAFIMTSIPYAVEIINHIEDVVNIGVKLDLILILKQIGWVFLWLIVAGILEVAIIFGVILPMANSELKSRW